MIKITKVHKTSKRKLKWLKLTPVFSVKPGKRESSRCSPPSLTISTITTDVQPHPVLTAVMVEPAPQAPQMKDYHLSKNPLN